MFRILIDTCVWFDIAKDSKQHPLIGVVEQMVREKLIELIVPSVVIDEFNRNRERIANDSAKSLSTHFRLVKDAIGKVGGDKQKTNSVLTYLNDIDYKLPLIGGAAAGILDRIEKLLVSAKRIDATEAIKIHSAERAITKKAPFHNGRNSMADAVIIETYADCVSSEVTSGVRFAFVTLNKSDFGDPKNFKLPHQDVRTLFSKIKSLYFVNLAEALRRVDPSFVSEAMLEYSWNDDPRGLAEILKAEDFLFHQVWYNRHWNLRTMIDQGKIKIVEKETPKQLRSRRDKTVQRNIWEGALKAARRAERTYGKKNLGPWTDFEWGMVNGKLSALRWVLGDEWDMLDT